MASQNVKERPTDALLHNIQRELKAVAHAH